MLPKSVDLFSRELQKCSIVITDNPDEIVYRNRGACRSIERNDKPAVAISDTQLPCIVIKRDGNYSTYISDWVRIDESELKIA